MKRENLAAGGAIGASLLIASCCLAPTVFLLFGVSIGALGMLTRLEPYRPLFIAAGGLALLYAGWRAWRPGAVREAGECGEVCAPDSPSRRQMRWLVASAMVLYGLAIAYPYALGALL